MTALNIADAQDIESALDAILDADGDRAKTRAIARLFVETLDFAYAGGVSLGSVPLPINPVGDDALTASAVYVAYRGDGGDREADAYRVVYAPVNYDGAKSGRVTAAIARDAAKAARDAIDSDDIILLLENRDRDELHIVHPNFHAPRLAPSLRRIVARKGQQRRTAVERLAGLYDDFGRKGIPIRDAVANAFSVEPVTKAFFGDYRRVFSETEAAITGFPDTPEGSARRQMFTQNLFNRLMFIYFAQRKGWMRYNGSADYLRALWDAHRYGENQDGKLDPDADDNFYSGRLRPLFFAGLNNDGSKDLTGYPDAKKLIGEVPFLNGGLFAKTQEEEDSEREGWGNSVEVPNAAIASIFTDLFECYNFTVAESTPYDQEVAVDPEMLGKMFEESVTERHLSGSFYTPREVVAFMCREAIKGHLAKSNVGVPPAAIAKFVDDRDAAAIEGASAATAVSNALAAVKAVDPACGSGAYLLGMMQELVELRTALFRAAQTDQSVYQLKRDIIAGSIYGVDKDEFAVNIAMLRLWLSMAVDYDGNVADLLPLPNLDYKIMRGDALASPDPSPENYGSLFRNKTMELADKFAELKADFLSESDGEQKRKIQAQIQDAVNALRQARDEEAALTAKTAKPAKSRKSALDAETPAPDAFDWRVMFADVFTANGGFDIVVANPPYVRQEDIAPKPYKAKLQAMYPDAAVGRSDLYCYFYARGLQLLNSGGVHAFICSNSWLDVGFGAKLQEHLLNSARVDAIYESAVERQFSTAAINTLISVAYKGKPEDAHPTRFVQLREEFDKALADGGDRRVITKTAAQLRAAGTDPDKAESRSKSAYVGDKWGGKHLRAPDIYHHILDKYADKFVRLGDIAEVRLGIITGANDFFYLKPGAISYWGIEPEFLAPALKSPKDSDSLLVDPAALPFSIFMCHKNRDELRGTNALRYIEWGESQGYHLRPTMKARKNWYNLGRRETPPVAINNLIHRRAKAFTMPPGTYAADTLQEVHPHPGIDIDALAAELNEDFAQVQYNVEGRANYGDGVLGIKAYEMKNVLVENPGGAAARRSRQAQPPGAAARRSRQAQPPGAAARRNSRRWSAANCTCGWTNWSATALRKRSRCRDNSGRKRRRSRDAGFRIHHSD